MTLFIFFTLLPLLLSPCHSLSVLILHPIYAGSHVLTLQTLATSLLSEGHHVTTIRYKDTHNLVLPQHTNHTQLERALNNSDGHLPYLSHQERAVFDLPQEVLWGVGLNAFQILKAMDAWKVMDDYCRDLLGDHVLFNQLMVADYDIAVVDLIYNECGLGLAHKLDLPVVGYWAFSFSSMQQDFTTAPAPPSFVPGFMSKLTDQMNFSQRSYNLLLKMFSKAMMTFHDWYMSRLIAEHVDSRPSSSALLNNLSGVLINTDYVIDYPRPMPPSFKNIGGLQISEKKQRLPNHIQTFMDNAEDGVVLFSMGFIFNPRVVPRERLQTLLEAFAVLPQRVIFKYGNPENSSITIPDNVLMLDWVPQQAVLAHKNCQVFLTHCGMHGVLESIHHGVPMVGMPVFIDQGDIMVRIEQRKIGVGIDKYSGKKTIVSAIKEVSGNPIYRTNVRKLSRVLRNRQNSPMTDAIWLLKHVSITGGAEHLKIKSGSLNFFQFYCLDCLLFWTLFLFLLFTVPCQRMKTKQNMMLKLSDKIDESKMVK